MAIARNNRNDPLDPNGGNSSNSFEEHIKHMKTFELAHNKVDTMTSDSVGNVSSWSALVPMWRITLRRFSRN